MSDIVTTTIDSDTSCVCTYVCVMIIVMTEIVLENQAPPNQDQYISTLLRSRNAEFLQRYDARLNITKNLINLIHLGHTMEGVSD